MRIYINGNVHYPVLCFYIIMPYIIFNIHLYTTINIFALQ